MQIETLKIFCDVVKFKSFSRGAQENNVSQSAASQTLLLIEARLGATLIDRSRRPWNLTPEGEIFYEGCREIIERYIELETKIKSFHTEVSSTIRTACIYSVGLSHMKYYIEEFSKLHPLTQIYIDCLHPDRVYESVLRGEADLGVVSFPQAMPSLVIIPWMQEPMVFACHPQHRFAHKRVLLPHEISGEKFVSFDKELSIRKEVDRFLRRHGCNIQNVLEFDNIEAIKRAVEMNSGVSILPFPSLEREIRSGTMVAIPFITNDLVRPLGIIHRKGKKFNPNTERFITFLLEKSKFEFTTKSPPSIKSKPTKDIHRSKKASK